MFLCMLITTELMSDEKNNYEIYSQNNRVESDKQLAFGD
jgi:hypothetical protein